MVGCRWHSASGDIGPHMWRGEGGSESIREGQGCQSLRDDKNFLTWGYGDGRKTTISIDNIDIRQSEE